MSVSWKSENYCLFVFYLIIFVITTSLAIALIGTKMLLLEAFAIKFQTFWSLTVATNFFLFVYVIFLFVNYRYIYIIRTFGITFLRKWRGRITNGVLYREALLELFFERFLKLLWVNWVLFLHFISFLIWVLPWTIVFYWRRYEFLVWIRTVEYFSYEIWSSE